MISANAISSRAKTEVNKSTENRTKMRAKKVQFKTAKSVNDNIKAECVNGKYGEPHNAPHYSKTEKYKLRLLTQCTHFNNTHGS